MYLSLHISLWFVVALVVGVGIMAYFWGRRDERRMWVERLGRR